VLFRGFGDELWGCRVTFEFPMVKLLDYESRWAELEASTNPFAFVVMAHLKTKETQKNPQSRKEWKFRLTRNLLEQGLDRQDIMELLSFLDWMMELPPALKQAFKNEIYQYQEARKMRFISVFEEIAVEDTQREIALKLLEEGVSIEIIARSTKLSIEEIQALQNQQSKE
jgi:hypothetical protein